MTSYSLSVSIPEVIPPSNDRPFARYSIQVNCDGSKWTIVHRYRTFNDFNEQVRRRFRNVSLPEFPKKKLVGTDSPAFLENRRLELMYYMSNLLKIEKVKNSREVTAFLSITENLRRIKSKANAEKAQLSRLLNETEEGSSSKKLYRAKGLLNLEDLQTGKAVLCEAAEAAADVDCRVGVHEAGATGKVERLRQLIGRDPLVVNELNTRLETPLHLACKAGHLEAAELLLACNSDATLADRDGWTPLHLGAKAKSHEIMKLILSSDQNVDVTAVIPATGEAPLLLNHGAELMVPDATGATALHYSAATGKVAWCSLLLTFGEADVNLMDGNGDTPLHYAARHGQNRTVLCLTMADADVTARSSEGTPLDLVFKRREQRQTNRLRTASGIQKMEQAEILV